MTGIVRSDAYGSIGAHPLPERREFPYSYRKAAIRSASGEGRGLEQRMEGAAHLPVLL